MPEIRGRLPEILVPDTLAVVADIVQVVLRVRVFNHFFQAYVKVTDN